MGHLLVSGLLTTELLKIPFTIAAVALAARLADAMGGSLWPSQWSLWAQLPLALVFGEFFMYWVHRLGHEVGVPRATRHAAAGPWYCDDPNPMMQNAMGERKISPSVMRMPCPNDLEMSL